MIRNDATNQQTCINYAFYSVGHTGVKTTANIIEAIETHNCELSCSSNYCTGQVSPEFGCNHFESCK